MSALKSLERYYPILDSHFQSFCASHGIFTGPFILFYLSLSPYSSFFFSIVSLHFVVMGIVCSIQKSSYQLKKTALRYCFLHS
uniref:Uncharacterized protein MANES_11G135500 n=1 Tax=Rhizophora mucronata TaxID=61149 RepID=A0A2P2LSX9_RHIMU